MTPELEPVAVLADRLQAEGDPRGELLSLELAAALADSTEESRRLCLAAHALRMANLELAWPRELSVQRGLIRAGLLVASQWHFDRVPDPLARAGPTVRELVVPRHKALGLHALHKARARMQLDGLSEQGFSNNEKMRELDLGPEQSIELASLGVARRLSNPEVLRQLHGLARLDMCTVPLWPELLEHLPALALRSLSLGLAEPKQLPALLDACPLLEQLTLNNYEHSFESHSQLERLRSLTMFDADLRGPNGDKLPNVHALGRLESLFVSRASRSDIERIAELGLRRLILFEPVGEHDEIVAALAKFDSLEHLGLLWLYGEDVDIAPLSALSRLRTLELGVCAGELYAPKSLERVVFRWSSEKARIHGAIATVHCRHFLDRVRANVDLTRTKTLSLDAASWEPRLEPDTLTALETLELDGHVKVEPEWISWLAQVPRLRAVIWPKLMFREQRTISEQLPHLQIVGADALRLRGPVWPKWRGFDPLAPSNWPKC